MNDGPGHPASGAAAAPCPAFCLVGPTASGKSAVAEWIAGRTGSHILSADSMTVYRGMSIGTAKPASPAPGGIPCYGLDLAGPDEEFSVGAYLARVRPVFARPLYSPIPPGVGDADAPRLIVCGGTGLYVKALLQGLDEGVAGNPEARGKWEDLLAKEGVAGLQAALRLRDPERLDALGDRENPRRLIRALELAEAGSEAPRRWKTPRPQPPVPCLRLAPGLLRARIEARVAAMYREGLIEEVRGLMRRVPEWSRSASQAIGYAEARAVLMGECTESDARERTLRRTVQLAKRQRTWFTHQIHVVWVDVDSEMDTARIAEQVVACWSEHGPVAIAG